MTQKHTRREPLAQGTARARRALAFSARNATIRTTIDYGLSVKTPKSVRPHRCDHQQYLLIQRARDGHGGRDLDHGRWTLHADSLTDDLQQQRLHGSTQHMRDTLHFTTDAARGTSSDNLPKRRAISCEPCAGLDERPPALTRFLFRTIPARASCLGVAPVCHQARVNTK